MEDDRLDPVEELLRLTLLRDGRPRPILDMSLEELKAWLRAVYPADPNAASWAPTPKKSVKRPTGVMKKAASPYRGKPGSKKKG